MVVSNIQALVINLECSKKRLEFQKQQLETFGISFERIPALSAKELDDSTYVSNSDSWERPLRRTEVACTMSHMLAWQKVLNSQKPFMILEDDALLSIHTKNLLNSLASWNNYDCINLETRRKKKILSLDKSQICENFRVSDLILDRCGAAAYVLWPKGAAVLLEWIKKNGLGLADAILSTGPTWHHGQIEPAVAIQIDCCEHYGIVSPIETYTEIHNIPKPRASSFYPYLLRRLRGQVRIAVKKLTYYRFSQSVELRPYGFKEST